MNKNTQEKTDKPGTYPKPSTEDKQFNNQPEFTEVQPNEFEDESVSDRPVTKKREDEEKGSRV